MTDKIIFGIYKKIAAGLLALSLAIGMVGCADTKWMMEIDGEKVSSGMYIYFAMEAFYNATNAIKAEDAEFDPTKKKDVQDAVFNNQKLEDYVKEQGVKQLRNYAATVKKFKDLNLSLDSDTQAELKEQIDSYWDSYQENMIENGIGKETIKKVLTCSYYNQEIFEAYYYEDGIENVTETDLQTYYVDNYARIKMITINFQDAGGNTLIGTAKEPITELANKYLARIKSGELDFDEAMSEYSSVSSSAASSYASSVSQSSLDAAATETDASGNTVGYPTSTTTTPTTTDPSATDPTTTTPTTTTTDKFANETVIEKVTTDTSSPDITNPISGVTTTTSAPTYDPNKAVNEAVFAQSSYDAPFVVEGDSAMYVLVRLDIRDRMSAEDLWTEDQTERVRSQMFSKPFSKMIEDLAKTLPASDNDASFKRYKPWKFTLPDFSGTA
jgi:hypothetical protein